MPVSPSALLRQTLALAACSAGVEVAVRATARAGWSVQDLGILLVATFVLTSALLVPSAGVALVKSRWLRRCAKDPAAPLAWDRPFGLQWGVLVGMHLSINYRFELVLNEYMRDPKVFLGVPAAFALGFVPMFAADRVLRRVPASALLAVAAGGALVGLARMQPAEHPGGSGPNVVIISMDTTRMDRLGPYGHAIHTPTIDRLAREGVTFEQAIAGAPITEPSHLAMLTGIAPYMSGIVANGTVLGDRPALLWRALAARGYATAGFVSGFPLHGKYDGGQGIDVGDDDFGRVAGVQSLSLVKAWNQVAIKEHALRERTADLTLSRAIPWIKANEDKPFFAFVHFYDVHGPYDSHGQLPPAPTDGAPLNLPFYWPAPDRRVTDVAWLEQAYDKEIEYVDTAVAQVVDALGPQLDNTILVLTADHGESFTEHDYLFDHGDNLYDPSLRVPLIVRYPKGAKAGVRVACQVGGEDIVPTVLALLQLDDGIQRDGHSLVAALGGGACESLPVFSSTVAGRMVEVPPVAHSRRLPTEKLIFHSDKAPEYYDLLTDPGELQSLESGAQRDALDELVRALKSGAPAQGAAQDGQTQQMLQALGYLDDGEEKAP